MDLPQSPFELHFLVQAVLHRPVLPPFGYEPHESLSPQALQQHVGVLGTYGAGVVVVGVGDGAGGVGGVGDGDGAGGDGAGGGVVVFVVE